MSDRSKSPSFSKYATQPLNPEDVGKFKFMLPKLGTSVAKVNKKLNYGFLKGVQDRKGSLTMT